MVHCVENRWMEFLRTTPCVGYRIARIHTPQALAGQLVNFKTQASRVVMLTGPLQGTDLSPNWDTMPSLLTS